MSLSNSINELNRQETPKSPSESLHESSLITISILGGAFALAESGLYFFGRPWNQQLSFKGRLQSLIQENQGKPDYDARQNIKNFVANDFDHLVPKICYKDDRNCKFIEDTIYEILCSQSLPVNCLTDVLSFISKTEQTIQRLLKDFSTNSKLQKVFKLDHDAKVIAIDIIRFSNQTPSPIFIAKLNNGLSLACSLDYSFNFNGILTRSRFTDTKTEAVQIPYKIVSKDQPPIFRTQAFRYCQFHENVDDQIFHFFEKRFDRLFSSEPLFCNDQNKKFYVNNSHSREFFL